jgi:6-phosphogluconolactonase (cycloisomerase 2 family)
MNAALSEHRRADAGAWNRIAPWLDELLDADPAAHTAELEAIARRDAALAGELSGWLARDGDLRRDGFLERPLQRESGGLEGQHVGRYRITRLLGQGAMGSVWLAHTDDDTTRPVAVKLLHAAWIGGAGTERFRVERESLRRLDHPHVARLLDGGTTARGQPYLVFEAVDGEPIDRWCVARSLDSAARVRLVIDLLEALAHVHARGVLHRDLKPSNILVAHDGGVKLLDFGIARLMDASRAPLPPAELTLAAHGAFTPAFAAPEQVLLRAVSPDLYAVGVLLQLLVGGRHPTSRHGATPLEDLQAIVDARPLLPARSGPQRGLRNIVARALAKAPEHRYPSAAAMADALRAWLGAATRTKSMTMSKPMWMLRLLALGGAALLGGCGGAVGVDDPAYHAAATSGATHLRALVVHAQPPRLASYSIDPSNGALRGPQHSAGTPGGPAAIAQHPSGASAYVASFAAGTVAAYSVGEGGAGLLRIGVPVAAGRGASSIAMHPSGRFAYVTNLHDDDITRFAIDPGDGAARALTPRVAAGAAPTSIAITPSGRFAYVANHDSNDLLGYRIDAQSGALTRSGARMETGANPSSVAIDLSGRFAIVANQGSNDISSYRIDAATGALAQACDRATSDTAPAVVAVHPSNRWLLALNAGSATVSVFAIDPALGCLRASGAPLKVGAAPCAIGIDPSGRHAYVVVASGEIGALTLDVRRGELALAGQRVLPGFGAVALSMAAATH